MSRNTFTFRKMPFNLGIIFIIRKQKALKMLSPVSAQEGHSYTYSLIFWQILAKMGVNKYQNHFWSTSGEKSKNRKIYLFQRNGSPVSKVRPLFLAPHFEFPDSSFSWIWAILLNSIYPLFLSPHSNSLHLCAGSLSLKVSLQDPLVFSSSSQKKEAHLSPFYSDSILLLTIFSGFKKDLEIKTVFK